MFDSKRCPICSSTLNAKSTTDETIRFCSNSCYEFIEYEPDNSLTLFIYNIFGESFSYFNTDEKNKIKLIQSSILEKIDFWLENEKYLCKILIK